MGIELRGILTSICVLVAFVEARGQEPVFNSQVDIDQAELLSGSYTLSDILQSGERFFSSPYQLIDGWGEGKNGPRAFQRVALYPYFQNFSWLRFNGIDSQSCFECHNSIGVGGNDRLLRRKGDATVGAAGIASNAYINDEFPTRLTKFLRNPPHALGSGYVQELAAEMTLDLSAQRIAVQMAAKADPNTPKQIELSSKGVSFGVFRSTYQSAISDYRDDTSGVVGVSEDLIVRPFQWKGIATDIRNFTRGALDFHFSLQPSELYNCKMPDGSILPNDGDKDGKTDEVTIGNVSALSAFVGMVRPPTEQSPSDPAQLARVDLGRQIFSGTGSPRIPNGTSMCADCHVPSLTLENAVYKVPDPQLPDCPESENANMRTQMLRIRGVDQVPRPAVPRPGTPTLINPIPRSRLFISKEIEKLRRALEQQQDIEALPLSAPQIHTRVRSLMNEPPADSYAIDLNNPSLDENDPMYCSIYPRLPVGNGGEVIIRLYSDLKRHDMGSGLTDVASQPTDTEGVVVNARFYLTRPLWGVAETGPYLHDGRAITLEDAILGHAVSASLVDDNPIMPPGFAERPLDPSSDAFRVVKIYKEDLSSEEREALIAFLTTLKISGTQDCECD